MVQHELLMVVAPLLCLAQPIGAWLWALPKHWRAAVGQAAARPRWRTVWAAITAPALAWALHAAVLWGWHVPAWFDAALRDVAVHTAQHLSFLGSALLFWWSALRPGRARHAAGLVMWMPAGMAYLAVGLLLAARAVGAPSGAVIHRA